MCLMSPFYISQLRFGHLVPDDCKSVKDGMISRIPRTTLKQADCKTFNRGVSRSVLLQKADERLSVSRTIPKSPES